MGWTGAINSKVCAMKSHWNLSQWTHPIQPIGPKTHVLLCFIVFGCIWDHSVTAWNSCYCIWMHLGPFRYCMKLVQLTQKFMPWSHIGIILNECTRSTPMDPKLMFYCISLYLGAFGTILLLHETRCKMDWTCAINAKVHAMKSLRNFSERLHPIHPMGP